MALPFDRNGNSGVLREASPIIARCKQPGGPEGLGHVTITFEPAGRVSAVRVDAGPFAETPTGDCIVAQLMAMHVAPFGSGHVRVGKAFTLR